MRFSAVGAIALSSGMLAACQTLTAVSDVVTGPSAGAETKAPEIMQAPATPSTSVVAQPRTAAAGGGLMGMTTDGLRAAWGEPSLKRSEAGAELWQYGGSSCTLLVYFYPDPSNALTVSHAEALPGGSDEAAVAACAKAAGKAPLKPIS